MRIRKDYTAPNGYWVLSDETRYVYDGMLVVQERYSSGVPRFAYSRGQDLSGSLQGAGGIGGMLARSSGYSSSTGGWGYNYTYHADGGGNITYAVASNGTKMAEYQYDSFGRTLSVYEQRAFTGNRYRFSSKEVHLRSGMYYYGYRFYDPYTQRWLNRDPLEELGGINLYNYVGNSAPNFVDPFGLSQEDVQKILDGYNQATGEMNKAGHRVGWCPPLSSLKCDMRPYRWVTSGKGWECVRQSEYLRDKLKGQQYDDQWTIKTHTKPNLTHTWVEATSSNPSDPKITLDPWWGSVNQQPAIIPGTPEAFPPISNTTVNNIPTVKIPPFSWGR
jgi:RHS repeat-associated protein